MKQENAIQIEELNQKLFERTEENNYLNQRIVKLEIANKEIRLAKDPKDEIKKM